MSRPSVAVVDYGISNLLNVVRALKHVGAEPDVLESPDELAKYDRVVLPGVGAFAHGMRQLSARGFPDAIRELARSGTPLLGICVGMQVLLDRSEEFGDHDGIGLIPGNVVRIPGRDSAGKPHKIPHIGWNELLRPEAQSTWEGTLFANTLPGDAVYFVHSFVAVPNDQNDVLATCDYGGVTLCAAVARDNIVGCQFHPEKSGETGLNMLRTFLSDKYA